LDVIEDPAYEGLTIEGDADVIDVELSRRDSPLRPIFQIRSRQEPYNWPPGEIAEVVRQWQEAGGGRDAPLVFVSDGSASPETSTRLVPALERSRAGLLTQDDRKYLARHAIDERRAPYVEVATRTDGVGGQLAMAESRVLRLLARAGPVSGDAPSRAVDRLFRSFAERGGEQPIEKRTFTRAELAGELGIDLASIDIGDEWTDELATANRTSVIGEPAPHPLVQLVALLDPTVSAPALTLTLRADEGGSVVAPATNLIEHPYGAGVCGPAGSGKTTCARQMTVHAAGQGQTAVLVPSPGYRRGDLERRIRRVLESATQRSLAPGAVSAALAETGATLLVDGLDGLEAEQMDAVTQDLHDVRDRWPDLRLILVARERALSRRFTLPTYTLSALSTDDRIEIATALVDSAPEVVADLEATLGDVVDNPLLFVMAVALTRAGIAANDRPQIFAEYLTGLLERNTNTRADETDLAVLRIACAALASEERTSADRYWWLDAAHKALEQLRAAGVYEVGQRSAEAVFNRLQSLGLLYEDEIAASVSLLHDLFRDYLASVALIRNEATLPAYVTPDWELTLELVAEQQGLTADHARALVAQNPVAAVRAGRLDTGPADAAITGELARTLCERHLGASQIGVDFGVIVVTTDTHRYALIAPDGLDAEMTAEEAEQYAERTPLAVALNREAGPLALAAALWRECIKKLTRSVLPSLLEPVPQSTDDLVSAIQEHFQRRQDELSSIASRIVPTIADRVVATVGWSGLVAHVGELESIAPFPGQNWAFHPLKYSYGGDRIAVTGAPNPEPDHDFNSQGIAESFVETPARNVAVKALVDALNKLLPEIS
jgi:hypothetical protein